MSNHYQYVKIWAESQSGKGLMALADISRILPEDVFYCLSCSLKMLYSNLPFMIVFLRLRVAAKSVF